MGALAVGLAAFPAFSLAQTTPAAQGEAKPAQTEAKDKKPKLTKEQQKELAVKLGEKTAEMESLKTKATTVTKGIGDLASSGKLPTSEEAIALMRKMVEEMSAIRGQLGQLQEEIEQIKGWIEGQNEALPIMALDIEKLKSNKASSYLQFQFRDTDQIGGATDAFNMRRVRLGSEQKIDSKTKLKWSFDLATSTTQTSAQLKDAFVIFDIEPSQEKVGVQVAAGQQPLTLGYELERSSSEREFPERAQYNQKMFNGERSRGINLKYGISERSHVHIGGWDVLSFTDPEQSAKAPGPENRLGMSGGIRFYDVNYDFGISAYAGERPNFTSGSGSTAVAHPRVDREFLYVDGTYLGFLLPDMYIRGEAMVGRDRLPVTGTPTSPRMATDMSGYQVQLGYNVNYRNQIHGRYEAFDSDTDMGGNTVKGYGIAWTHYLNPGARISASHEIFEDPFRASIGQQRYQITTLRVQFKF